MRFVDFLYDDQLVDEMTLRVLLPEKVSDVEMKTPYPVSKLPMEVEKTYLDTSGRIVLVAKKSNLVGEHIQDFVVS